MLNTILNAMRVSHPVTETVNRSDNQHAVSIDMGNAGNTHRLPSADRHHASSFVRGFLKVSEWVKGLLSPMNQQTAFGFVGQGRKRIKATKYEINIHVNMRSIHQVIQEDTCVNRYRWMMKNG